MSVAGLILAAGESTRMGRLKQLLPWDNDTLLGWQIGQMVEAGAEEVVVVLGHEAEAISEAMLDGVARIVVNADYRSGRASSLRCAAEAVREPVAAVAILSVDQPRPAWLTRRLVERRRETGAAIVQPRFGRHRSHPVIVTGALLEELRGVREEDLGLRAVLERHADDTDIVSLDRGELDVDLNTPADYEMARDAFARGEWAASDLR